MGNLISDDTARCFSPCIFKKRCKRSLQIDIDRNTNENKEVPISTFGDKENQHGFVISCKHFLKITE